MHSVPRLRALLPCLVLLLACPLAVAGDGKSPPAPPPVPAPVPPEVDPGPDIVVHVPTDEMDVLLETDRRGVVLRHGEYQRLLTEARANAARLGLRPPVDGSLVSARGTLDLTDAETGRVRLDYEVSVLADGPSVVPFVVRGFALDRVEVEGEGRYEELDGNGRLRFHGAGPRRVHVEGFVSVHRKGEQRLVDVLFAPAAAMALDVTVPQAVEGTAVGEGVSLPLESPAEQGRTFALRPDQGGRLRIAWGPAQRGTQEGPPVFDVQTRSLHAIEDGLIRSRVVLHVDVLRTPVSALDLALPPAMAIRAVEGKGVTGSARSEDRARLRVELADERRGRITITLDGETPYQPAENVLMPRILLPEAVRHRGQVALRFESGVEAHDVRVEGGRRLPSQPQKGAPPLLRYALARSDGGVTVDLLPADLRLEASSTYYLNLTEPAKSLLAAVTYRVRQGMAFGLQPRFPSGYGLRSLTVNGQRTGFAFDQRSDGTVEVRLERGVPEGQEIALVAALEQAAVDWVPETGSVALPFALPSAGADREEGFLGIGADASFNVLDAAVTDLVAVGAAALTSRGVSPAGLVYGYRLDGPAPSVRLEIERRASRIDATVVAWAVPTPRRLTVHNLVIHVVERAGVRRLLVDVPTWARDVVHVDAPDLVSTSRVEDAQGVPEGYDRWEVVLTQRVLGRHLVAVRYWEDQDEDDWRVGADRPLAVALPLEHVERSVIVARAPGLEVGLEGDAQPRDLAELPTEASIDPLAVREVVRLLPAMPGPGIVVKKHDGAPVLDAIATHVFLRTAVAREGILRTRATVNLVNVGLQYVRVQLPPDSELIGAVVDGESVKPLSDPDGVLRIPVPPAHRCGGTTSATLTYETRLGREALGDVEIPAPAFPGLEVLKTTHEVAFDPGVEIREVSGDYGSTRTLARMGREPWLLRLLDSMASRARWAARDDARAPGATVAGDAYEYLDDEDEKPAGAVTRYAADRDDQRAQVLQGENTDLRQRAEAQAQDATLALLQQERQVQDKLVEQVEQLQRLNQEVRRKNTAGAAPERSVPADLPAAYEEIQERLADGRVVTRRVAVGPPSMREPTDPSPPPPPMMPAEPSPDASPDFQGLPVPTPSAPTTPAPIIATPPPASQPMADPALGAGGGAGGRFGRPRPGGEGPDPAGAEPPSPPKPPRRKGLLSLDVPVLLSPNTLTAERLGGGGAMTVAVVARQDTASGYWFAGLVSLACGLAFATRGRRLAFLVPVLGFVLALLTALIFRGHAGAWPAALADASTALVGVLVLRWLVGRLIRTPAAVTTTALVLLGLLVASTDARADEANDSVVKTPRTVYVPYDPDDPEVPRADDRVFLPLDIYLELRRLAHPEEDPDVLARGKAVSILGATHRLRIGKEEATGTLVFGLTKRGAGLSLVPLPIGGLAVAHATLDGEPQPLLLEAGQYHVPLEEEGDHLLEIEFRAPVVRHANGRRVAFRIPPFAGTLLDVRVDDFDGELEAVGAGAVIPLPSSDAAAAWRVHLGGRADVDIALVEPRGADPEVALRTRVESRVVHSIRDGGTESRAWITLHVLQGKADHLDVDLPAGVSVLQAGGPAIARWETTDGRLRLVFAQPQEGVVEVQLAVSRATDDPTRLEELPALAVQGTTGERGLIVVNGDPFLRVEPTVTDGLLRTATPGDEDARGPDKAGRVAGAWHFATRPTRFAVSVEEAPEGLAIDTRAAVVFGDDHVRSRFDATVRVDERVPVGDLVFDLPGDDEVRSLTGSAVAAWWTEGTGDARTLHVRQSDLRRGDQQLVVRFQRRLGGRRDAVAVPRWRLQGAKRDRGEVQLFALTDVDPDPGRLPGLRSVPIVQRAAFPAPMPNATLVRAFTWEEPPADSLPVTLRTPPLEAEAVVVTSVHPGDESHRLEHLVLFDVRRGLTDQFDVFVPDGGMSVLDVVRTRDLSEVRPRQVKRRGPDGVEVDGTLYEIHVQSARSGIVEIMISQIQRPDLPVRVVRPERVVGEGNAQRDVKAVQWFGLVRTFLDGEMDVRPVGEPPDPAEWADLPFLPVGIQRADVRKFYAARTPYVLAVEAKRRQLKEQSDAVVRSAQADIVLGRDGQARVRVRYRLFNRRRQFLRVHLPAQGVLFGVTVAGRPVKPLAGSDGDLLIPVPKVPVGGAGYPVAVLYRAPAGPRFPEGALDLALPEIKGPTVDRTVVRLFVPRGFDYDIETDMAEAGQEDVAADLAEAAVREARELIEVAKSGTLEQRQRAAQSAAVLVGEANDLNLLAGNKQGALGREVQQVTQEFDENFKSVVSDLEAASREATGAQLDFFASNAAPILAVQPSQRGQTRMPGQAGESSTANFPENGAWCFNPAQVEEKGAKQEIAALKERLGKALDDRAQQQSMVQDFDVQIAQAADISRQGGADGDVTWRNFGALNGILGLQQQQARQLGVVAQPQAGAGFFYRPQAGQTIANLDDVTNGLEDQAFAGYDNGGGGLTTGANLDPCTTGIFFDDGGDGDFRTRTENMFQNSLGSELSDVGVDLRGLTSYAGRRSAPATEGRARQGLMGVDVVLPQDGEVYLFRGLKAGAPLRVTVSAEGTSPFVRWLLFVLCLGALIAAAVGVVRWRRKPVAD